MNTLKPLMKVCNLNVYYRGIRVLKQVNLTVCAGQIVSIVGPNGSGKTTVVNKILERIPAGQKRSTGDDLCFTGERL